jgi:hypothetical protein
MTSTVAKSVVKTALDVSTNVATNVGTNVATNVVTTATKSGPNKFEKLCYVTGFVGAFAGLGGGASLANYLVKRNELDYDIKYNCLEYSALCTGGAVTGLALGSLVGYSIPLFTILGTPLFVLNYAGIIAYDVVKAL